MAEAIIPREHDSWDDFEAWAKANSVDMRFPYIWSEWWKCWLAGYEAGRDKYRPDADSMGEDA